MQLNWSYRPFKSKIFKLQKSKIFYHTFSDIIVKKAGPICEQLNVLMFLSINFGRSMMKFIINDVTDKGKK